MNARVKIITAVQDIEEWKARMLVHVASAISSNNQGELQKSISAWRVSDALPFPFYNNIRINGGCLVFDVEVAEYQVAFSVWYTFGEVRVGVKVPTKLLYPIGSTDKRISQAITNAYDGTPCQKITSNSEETFFDWIFRDNGVEGFASFTTASKAVSDANLEFAIASKLVDILIHIYMATMNNIIEGRGYKVGFKKIVAANTGMYFELRVAGDIESFEYFLRKFGTVIKKSTTQGVGIFNYVVMAHAGVKGFPVGDGSIDGGHYSILESKQISATAVQYN